MKNDNKELFSKKDFNNLIRLFGKAIIKLDLKTGKYDFVLGNIEKYGYSKENFQKKFFIKDIMHPEDVKNILLRDIKLMNEGKTPPLRENFRIKNPKGGYYFVEQRNHWIKDKEGNFTHLMAVLEDKTKEKTLEEKLKKNEELYETLVERANDGILLIHNKKIIFVNKKITKMFGYSKNEILNTDFTKYVSKKEIPKLLKLYVNRFLGKKVPTIYETILINKNGEEVIVEVNGGLVDYEGKKCDLVFIRDITERKKTAEKIIESEEKFRTLFDNLNDGVVIYDYVENQNDFVFVDLNKAVEKMEGVRRKHVIGKRVTKVFPIVKKTGLFDVFQRVFKTGTPEFKTIVFRDKKNKIYAYRKNYVFKLPDNHLVVIYKDLTKEKVAEQKIIESEEKFRTLFETANIGISLMKKEVFTDCNQKFLELFGLNSKKQIIGKTIYDFFPQKQTHGKDSKTKAKQLFNKTLKGQAQFLEWKFKKLNNTVFDAEVTLSRLIIKNEPYILIFVKDITERKKIEQKLVIAQKKLKEYSLNLEKKVKERTKELKKTIKALKLKEKRLINSKKALINLTGELNSALKELKKLDEMKTRFLSTISHELRTPMTPMKAQLQMLLKKYFGELNDEQEESLRIVLNNTERLDSLIADLLDVSRIQAKALKLFLKKNSLNEVIKETLKLLEPKIKKKGLDISIRLTPLPKFYFDKNRITQVMINLLDNAVKFTPKGKISVFSKKSRKKAIVVIKDTGVGISKEIQSKLFHPFIQEDTSKTRNFGGTGLGLSICKGIIDAHNGRIWFESKKNKGSTFYFELPIKESLK